MKEYVKSLDGEIENVYEDNIVAGFFTSDTVDVDGHIVFKEDVISRMQEFLQWGNIRVNHQQPVGVLVEYDPNNWNFFKVRIVDEDVWKKTKERVYKGFSLGLKVAEDGLKRIPLSQISPDKYMHLPEAVVTRLKSLGFVQRIKDFYIAEISITDRPRNTKSTIAYFKSETGDAELPSLMEGIMDEKDIVGDGEDAQKSEPTITQDESVTVEATQVVETDVVNSEDVVSDVVKDEVVEKSEQPVNAELGWKDAFDALSTKMDTVIQSLTIALADVSTQLSNLSGTITKSEVIDVSKSDALDAEQPRKEEDFISLKTQLVEELKLFVKSEFGESSGERKGSINIGDSVEEVVPLDITNMPKSDSYSIIANIIAKNIKR